MNAITLPPASQIQGEITLPGSKSLSNRALLLAALSETPCRLHNLLDCDDTRHMRNALSQLGVKLSFSDNFRQADVQGTQGCWLAPNAPLFLGNAGTAMRFLTAALCLNPDNTERANIYLTGEPRMQERPIADLVDALRQGGAEISYEKTTGYPPLTLHSVPLKGGKITIRGDISSQFLSAILMVLPLAQQDSEIEILGTLVSKPYVEMTLKMMAQFGVQAKWQGRNIFIKSGQTYHAPADYYVEGDASSASYFMAAAAIAGEVTVHGIDQYSLQGDRQFADVLAQMGAKVTYGTHCIHVKKGEKLQGLQRDHNAIPDAAMTLATLALFAENYTCIQNVANWRVKETDRLHAMAHELQKIGASVVEGSDSLQVAPLDKANYHPQPIETYRDHRIAMCFALTTFAGKPVTLLDPTCVNKTFPQFFSEWQRLTS